MWIDLVLVILALLPLLLTKAARTEYLPPALR